MGFIGDVFSGSKGAGFESQGAPIESGVTPQQIAAMYGQGQGALDQQQAFANALAAQNGIGNQSSVFAQQQGLANQLGAQSRGEGPNPALAQLAQTTGQNVQQQAALMGSQRGINANAGLLARQAAQQGGAIQQQAVGQGAIMRANQQLAAQQLLGQQQAQMGNIATQQVGQQQNALSNYGQMNQNQQQILQNALAQKNNANVGMQSNINSSNAGVAQVNAKGQQDFVGGLFNGAAGALKILAKGGLITHPDHILPMLAEGGSASLMPHQSFIVSRLSVPQIESENPNALKEENTQVAQAPVGSNMNQAGSALAKTVGEQLGKIHFTDQSPMTSAYFNAPPSLGGAGGRSPSLGAGTKFSMPKTSFDKGGKVPGTAKVKGDSYSNDHVKALLSPGEIVLPRSVTMGKDAPEKAAKFVAAVRAQNRGAFK